MVGRVGTVFGAHGINIASAAVGHTDDASGKPAASQADRSTAGEERSEAGQRLAAMVVTTDAPVPDSVVQEIVASEGFFNGWSVDLGEGL